MSMLSGLKGHYSMFGVRGVLANVSHRLIHWPTQLTCTPKGMRPLYLRLRTSDVSVYSDIIVRGEYKLDLPGFEPKIIVDAGANCGMASVVYANAYPEARIIAIEPDRSNFEMLVKNVRAYPNVTPIHAALWHEDGEVSLSGCDDAYEKWGIHAVQGSGVRALTVETLMREHQIQAIDLFKVDIEGGEKELFRNAPWMSKVKLLCIELHDRLIPGCREPVTKSAKGFRSWENGELTFFSSMA